MGIIAITFFFLNDIVIICLMRLIALFVFFISLLCII
jgi:hypothetical protein